MGNVFRSIRPQSQGFSELANLRRKEFVAFPNRKTQPNHSKKDISLVLSIKN